MDTAIAGDREGVVAKVLAALDIILVVVGPMQLDFLPFVGNRIDAFLVSPKRQKIALVVVTAEEVKQIGEDLVLQSGYVDGGRQPLAKLLYLRRQLGIDACVLQLQIGRASCRERV